MKLLDTSPPIFDRMAAIADPLRSRLLLVLERHELTVGELCAVFQLPQSSMSRQLRVLVDEGWLVSRAEGTSRRYRMLEERLDGAARELWAVVRGATTRLPGAAEDALRLRSVMAERRSRSRDFFSTAAGRWDQVRADLYGRRQDLHALLGLLDADAVIGDLGCGTGQIAASLAPFVRGVVAVDESPEMLDAARERLAGVESVSVREGSLESLPLADGELDAAVAFLVLHYLAEPGEAIAEAARALRPGGTLLVVDMVPHGREEYRQSMGHLWQGFSEERMTGWLAGSGLERIRWIPLPADPEARGPGLFAASGRKVGSGKWEVGCGV
jgi:ubiquinone/menaquinone biosynthesis C-methylase UbiE/DNA-binding transcriptional ArsR family regulator